MKFNSILDSATCVPRSMNIIMIRLLLDTFDARKQWFRKSRLKRIQVEVDPAVSGGGKEDWQLYIGFVPTPPKPVILKFQPKSIHVCEMGAKCYIYCHFLLWY